MREIKFRIRHKNTGKIIGYEYLVSGIWHWTAVYEGKICGEIIGASYQWGIREQYSGIKDRIGREIYEGDEIEEGKVIFDESYLGFFIESEERKPLYDIPTPMIKY